MFIKYLFSSRQPCYLNPYWPFFCCTTCAGRWPRFVRFGLGLGFRTLFGGNGAVNTKGLVQRAASLTVCLCVYVCGLVVGG